ncbi:protein tweety isoform X2 [Leptopilina boulardi]|uniref:protein tweety isoform X2 n=1 Tax=Leptopilina boulardi TaxID=63433 RepID=UPI0021F544BC|nr:protein tweety isoform X2 [Leptopilina boulardi]
MAGGQLPEQYAVTQLTRFFHNLPHLNVSLHSINNTFNHRSEIYLESLGILGSIPAAWLIFTLLVLLVYLVTRCCDRKPRHRRSIALLKCSLAIFALFCCGAVAVGLYGNDDVHNGIIQLITAVKHMNDLIMDAVNQTDKIEQTVQKRILPQMTTLEDEFDAPANNKTILDLLLKALERMNQNATIVVNRSYEIGAPLNGVGLAYIILLVERIEQLRWPITMAVLSVLLILCVVLLVGVARHSRCALITFSVFGLFAIIISWLMTSMYLATSVALGDLCMSPDGFFISMTADNPNPDDSKLVSYYLQCESTLNNPFTRKVREGMNATDNMRNNLKTMKLLAEQLYKDQQSTKLVSINNEINTLDRLWTGLQAFLDCKPFYKQYTTVVKSLCHLGLYGLTFMLAASLAAGFLFTILVWVDSHTWIYIRKRDYHQVEEQDPFLPPSAASQAIAARTLRGQGSYPPTAPSLNPNIHGNHNTIKQPLLLTPPPPSYATATARARQLHESMLKGGGINGSGGDHKTQHNQHSTSGRNDHRTGLDQPGQYATLSKQCKTLESSDFY